MSDDSSKHLEALTAGGFLSGGRSRVLQASPPPIDRTMVLMRWVGGLRNLQNERGDFLMVAIGVCRRVRDLLTSSVLTP